MFTWKSSVEVVAEVLEIVGLLRHDRTQVLVEVAAQ